MKMLLESIRKKLGRPSHAGPAETDQGIPFAQESASRRISAPTSWLCGVTDAGRRRRNNEDEYFLSADGKLWIVADGMGGHAAGEVASALTIDAIVVLAAQDAEPDRVHAGDRLARAFAAAQDVVSSRGQSDADCLGMGSTAIAAIVDEEGLHLCHVGDVRGYHWSQGQFRHVTNDHSLVWELVLSGILLPPRSELILSGRRLRRPSAPRGASSRTCPDSCWRTEIGFWSVRTGCGRRWQIRTSAALSSRRARSRPRRYAGGPGQRRGRRR